MCCWRYVLPEIEPDVVIMWLCEPDASQHARGLGSPEALDAIRGNDAPPRTHPRRDRGDAACRRRVIVASDHGHSTVTGMVRMEHDAGRGGLRRGARRRADSLMAESMSLIEDGPGAATLRDEIGAWLREQPWVGAFMDWSRGHATNGLLSPGALWNEHDPSALPYAPTFTYSHAWTDEPNAHGVPGSALAGYAAGLADLARLQGPIVGLNRLTSTHGTLGPRDQRTVLALGGAGIRPGTLDVPAGVVDIAPTILALLGLPPLPDADGRALTEAFADGPDPASVIVRSETLGALRTGYYAAIGLDGPHTWTRARRQETALFLPPRASPH